ncbi:sugar phosphate isomerase/epimerase [Planctomycetales bacterium ZRK34]|nr:sugar phosphate isomerase/epimerase [Planctomycetales bacterium ZRK34]
MTQLSRRSVLAATASLCAARFASPTLAASDDFKLNYILSSAMYGKAPLTQILPQVRLAGARVVDIWPAPHGNQREQVDQMGVDKFGNLLAEYECHLGGIACYRFGAMNLQPQMKLAADLYARDVALVCGGQGPKDATGEELKKGVKHFVEKLKPHHEAAAKHACFICIENHVNNIICSPDSMKYFAEYSADLPRLGIAFAPHHLPQDAALQARLIEDLGPAINFFYAQEHGKGSHHKQPREDEHLQMPHLGPLDFKPLVAALRKINFTGRTEIFMHPFPRGVPILDSNDAITAEINDCRAYLDRCVQETRS